MQPRGIITALEMQKRGQERVNVYIDGEFAFALGMMEAAHLKKGQTLTQAEIEALRGEDSVLKAVDSAARFLAHRPRSIHEVRQNLAQKKIAAEVVEQAVERLTTMGYLDDMAFARFWVENRSAFKPLGPQALKYELRQKGVLREIIDEVLGEMVSEDDMAYQAAQERAPQLRHSARRDFKQKLGVFLQRRGFTYSASTQAIRRLMDEFDTDDPSFFSSGEDDNA